MLRYNDYEALIFALYIGENISKNIDESILIDKFRIIEKDKCSEFLVKLKERFIVDLYEEKFDTKSEICKEIDEALDNKCFIDIETRKGKLVIIPISYVLRKEGLCLYCYSEEYNLILVNEIYSVKILNKSYDKNIISYIDNKKNLKLI